MSNEWIRSRHNQPISSIELFAGCGAMAMGLHQAGLRAIELIESCPRAVATLNHNRTTGAPIISPAPVGVVDISQKSFIPNGDPVRVLTGGPPCEGTSIAGKKQGAADLRNKWPDTIRSVAETEVECFLFENVPNMDKPSTGHYADIVLRQLANPKPGLNYHVRKTIIECADYGAAQYRKRILFAGFRADLYDAFPGWPPRTHSAEALIHDKWVTGDYWRRHGIEPIAPDASERATANQLVMFPPEHKPHRTVRDAIADLGDPNGLNDHVHRVRGKGKLYRGHDGSRVDHPAKTLKSGCKNHGLGGGENFLLFPDGTSRAMTVREGLRLQGLPDTFSFPNSLIWGQKWHQIGNAVPLEVATYFGEWIVAKCRLRDLKSASMETTIPEFA